MPVEIIGHFLWEGGFLDVPYVLPTLKTLPVLFFLYVLKIYFGGARNTAERDMHGKVVIMTGGTSGIGQATARELASRGAQLVLLTQHPLNDHFLSEYILDLREQTNNELITAEQVDLASLHGIRTFATKWIDNAPPRRLDMVILCADNMTPKGSTISPSVDGVESTFAVNYLANFHLLSILSPALRVQPPDRDVRIIIATCSSYLGGQLPEHVPLLRPRAGKSSEAMTPKNPGATYASSKLALMTFAAALQKHLSSYVRPDGFPMNAKVIMADPGYSRTPGMRRFITFGSLWGLAFYLVTWPFWWFILKGPEQGAQTLLHGAMESSYARGDGGILLKECMEYKVVKDDVYDEAKQKKLWEMTEQAIEALEKEGAMKRAQEKKDQERKDQEKKDQANDVKVPLQPAEKEKKQASSRRSRKTA